MRVIRFYYVIIGLSIFISLLTVPHFPVLLPTDEAWLLSYADGLRWTGEPAASIAPGSPGQLAGLIHLTAGNFIGSLTNYSPHALRYVAALSGIGLLGALYLIGRVQVSHKFGVLCAVLGGTNLFILAASHIGRADMPMAACLWGGLALMLFARKHNSLGWSFGAGILTALSIHMHLIGALTCLAMGIWWLTDWKSLRKEWKLVVCYILGGVIVSISFFFSNIALDLSQFMEQLSAQRFSHGTSNLSYLSIWIERHLFYGQFLEMTVLYFSLLASLFVVRNKVMLKLSGLIIIIMALYMLLVRDLQFYYIVAWVPGLVVLLAYTVLYTQKTTQKLFIFFTVVSILLNIQILVIHFTEQWNAKILAAQESVVAAFQPNEIILGANTLYYSYRKPNFIGVSAILHLEGEGLRVENAIAKLNPDFILSGNTTPVVPFVRMGYGFQQWQLGWDLREIAPTHQPTRTIETELGYVIFYRRQQ